jgi:glycogen(starch) synthase
MKILLYSHFFAPSIGGVETIVLSLARGLAELRSPSGGPEFDLLLVTQTPAENFDDCSLVFRTIRRPSLVQLWHLIRGSDVIHVAGPSLAPLFLSRLAGKPVVLEHHGYQAICPNGLLLHEPDKSVCPGHFQAGRYAKCLRCNAQGASWLRSWISLLLMFVRHWLARRVAANLAITQHSLRRHALPRSSVVYYGIEDSSVHSPQTGSDCAALPTLCFAFVGRFVQEKGIPVLLEAARILLAEGYTFEVRLIGDGPERSHIEEIIVRHNLSTCVHITGFLKGAALAEALRAVHVVVMPSVWEETAGLAAIEQMMRARLVIASAIGGLREVVGPGGLTFPAGDAPALADHMKAVLQNPTLLETLGQNARDRALKLFLRGRMIVEHIELYRKVVRGRNI